MASPLKIFRFKCPRCGKVFECSGPASHKAFPFCSKQCQMVDLGNWLGERYLIPGDKDVPGAPVLGEREDRRLQTGPRLPPSEAEGEGVES